MNERDIRHAFETMGPSEEAQGRMLANILGAADRMREAAVQEAPVQEAAMQEAPSPIAFQPQKRHHPWRIALPIAACLVLAVGIGVMVYASGSLQSGSPSSSASMAQGSGPGSSGGSGSNGLGAQGSDSQKESSAPEGAPQGSVSDQAPTTSFEYYIIEIPGLGTTSVINPDDPGQSLADAGRVGDEMCRAIAYNSDESRSVECTVFEYASTDLSCLAIQFPDDPNYYLVLDPAKSSQLS